MLKKFIKIVLIASALVAFFYFVYFIGLVLEFEYPFWLILRDVKQAKLPSGLSVNETVASRLSIPSDKVRWHICSYCNDRCGLKAPYFSFQCENLLNQKHDKVLFFAFNRTTKEIVPMSQYTASLFPELIPKGHQLVECNQLGSGEKILLPDSWLTIKQNAKAVVDLKTSRNKF